ncbi:hypothetical protein FCH31_06810 [Lelliottia amnigena]|nr:hypothetical protein [Lelliottia amnigena]
MFSSLPTSSRCRCRDSSNSLQACLSSGCLNRPCKC